MNQNKLLIAIDGPAASGKGTLAKKLGEKLNLPVLHTGNIYRAIGLKLIENKLNPDDEAVNVARTLKIEDLHNEKLNQEIVGEYASKIAVYKDLRQETFAFQRKFIDQAINGAIVEGRDIGTVICPEAKFKFYIEADVEVRANRRCLQNKDSDYHKILHDLKLRDKRDSERVEAPLKPAKDAIIIDTSNLDVEESLSKIVAFLG